MCVKGAAGLGAEPSIYFGKEGRVGRTERSLCPSLCPCPRRVSSVSPWTLCTGLTYKQPGPADGPLLALGASCSLKELADEAHFCAKPLESSLASIIKENDAIGKICWKQ